MTRKQFRTLASFQRSCKFFHLRCRKVTTGKKNVYYQAITKSAKIGGGRIIGGTIVGYFNEVPGTGRGHGEL